jgi:hypothetical protein
MAKSYLTQTQRNVLAWRWMPSCAGRHMSRKDAKSLEQNKRIWIGSWEEDRPCRYTISWCCTNKYRSLCGPTAYSFGDARNRATLTLFNDFITRYLGTSLKHIGISETPTSIGTFVWRWLRIKLKSSLRSMKKSFCTTSPSKRSSCSTTVD